MRMQAYLALAAATLLLGACGSDSPSGPGDGAESSFSANLAAPVGRAFTGDAAFGSDNTDPEVGFALGMVEPGEAGDDMVLFHRVAAGVPANGAITIADGTTANVPDAQLIGTVILDANTADPMLCLSRSGTLTVTSSAATRLKGTFTMQVDCVRLVSEVEVLDVTATGTFDAIGGSVVIPD